MREECSLLRCGCYRGNAASLATNFAASIAHLRNAAANASVRAVREVTEDCRENAILKSFNEYHLRARALAVVHERFGAPSCSAGCIRLFLRVLCARSLVFLRYFSARRPKVGIDRACVCVCDAGLGGVGRFGTMLQSRCTEQRG